MVRGPRYVQIISGKSHAAKGSQSKRDQPEIMFIVLDRFSIIVLLTPNREFYDNWMGFSIFHS